MKLAKKILRRGSSKSNSGKWVYRCAAPEGERVVKEVVDSLSEFNEVEFQEYDPTPYDGGFDIALTYGKPLTPSDAICYTRSDWDPNSKNLEEFSYGSVIAPYGQDPIQIDREKPQNGSGLRETYVEEKPSYDGNGNLPSNPVPSLGCDFLGGDIYSYGNGYGNGYGGSNYEKPIDPYQGEEERGSYGYEMPEYQPGHDSHVNSVQPYEDLFGGWLWSARGEGDSYSPHDVDKPSNGDQWNGTVDYIFGFSYPYGERRDESHSYGNLNYCYEKHIHAQPHHVLVKYQEPSWAPKASYHQAFEDEVHTQTEYVSLDERHSQEQHQFSHNEYSDTSWFQKPGNYETYQEEGYPGLKYVSLYERHSHEQPQYGHSETSWFQMPDYDEAYQEEGYIDPKYDDDSYRESGEVFYQHNHKYAVYDE